MTGKPGRPGGNHGGGRKPLPNATRYNVITTREVHDWLKRNGNISAEIERIAREQMGSKTIYTAYVINDQGASETAGDNSSLTELKKDIRRKYGKGWTVVISKLEDDPQSAPIEIERFTLRK